MVTNFSLCINNFFANFSVMLIAVLPLIEAKGAIPIGMSMGLSPLTSLCFSYIGSLLPVPFLLHLLTPFMDYINHQPKFYKLSQKLNQYIHKKTSKISKNNWTSDKPIRFFAVFLFVALPLPGTGVWSGSVVASAFHMKKTNAFIAIASANFFASMLIFLATFGFFV
jgi:uncharacterized membrane protein